jgi:hypothetical protein
VNINGEESRITEGWCHGSLVYDERQRQDDELRLGRRLQKRGGSSSLVSQE